MENDPEKIKAADVTDNNYAKNTITSGGNSWASPELDSVGDDQNIYSCLVTQLQDADGKFSYTVGNVSKNSAYALAQGKSTTYYSDNDPETEGYHIKNGDC